MRLRIAPRRPNSLPDLMAVITPKRDNDWDTGSAVVIVDRRNSAVVPHEEFSLRKGCEPGRPIKEWWSDVVIRGERMRLPVEFSEVTR